MIKLGDKNFIVTDDNGAEVPFSAAELQGELIYCFLNAGMRDSSCFAEDIALAVEYAAHEKIGSGSALSAFEINEMVVESLENAGFYVVSDWFKRRNERAVAILFDTNEKSLHDIAVKHGLLYPDDGGKTLAAAVNAFKSMGIDASPLGLIIEILRFYRGASKNPSKQINTGRKKRPAADYLVKTEDVAELFPVALQEFLEQGVLKIQNVTIYHPSIRIFLDIEEFAERKRFDGVLTEMVWMPYAAELGQSMDAAVEVMQRTYNESGGEKTLPVYLTLNRMGRFAEKYFGCAAGQGEKLANFIVESLSSNMFYELYKVRF